MLAISSFVFADNYANGVRTALVIGNSAYKSSPLTNPRNDATDIAKSLKSLGFNVIKVLDGNLKQMNTAVSKFGRQLEKKGGVGLFFYAGHGVQSAGRNYLIPVKSNVNRETDLKYNALDAGRVLDEMGYANNGLNIAILDACRNNPLTRSFRSGKKGLARIDDAPTGLLIAYSTAPGKQAADGDGRNSPYTKSLLKAIQEKGLPLEVVFKKVIKSVKEQTRGKQIPWVSSSVDGDFYFKSKDKPKKLASIVPIRQNNPIKNSPSSEKFEILYWESVTKNPSKKKYQAYINKYPKGHFVELARNELKTAYGVSKSQHSNRGMSVALKQCQQFLKNNQLTNGKNGNALDCFQKILAKDPNNQSAHEGITSIETSYEQLINRAIKNNEQSKIKTFMTRLELVNPYNQQLKKFKQLLAPKPKPIKQESIIKKAPTLSHDDEQAFIEYSEVIDELIIEKNYRKADFYLKKLEKISPNHPKLFGYRNKLEQSKNGEAVSVHLSEDDQQIFKEYLEVLDDILSDSGKLSSNQQKKSEKYIAELEKLNAKDKELIRLKAIYLNRLATKK